MKYTKWNGNERTLRIYSKWYSKKMLQWSKIMSLQCWKVNINGKNGATVNIDTLKSGSERYEQN